MIATDAAALDRAREIDQHLRRTGGKMISEGKIQASSVALRGIFMDMIEHGAGAHEIQRAIMMALAGIARDTAVAYAASIAGELTTRIQGAIASLKGKK